VRVREGSRRKESAVDVQLVVLADNANVAAGDKLNIMGVFDTIFASAFPTAHPYMVLAIRFRVGYEDGGKTHNVVISLRDEDEKEYLRATAEAVIPKLPPGAVQHLHQILNFAGMQFGKVGKYAFHILVNGEEKGRADLQLVQGPAPGIA
jgi:hypothetical protein